MTGLSTSSIMACVMMGRSDSALSNIKRKGIFITFGFDITCDRSAYICYGIDIYILPESGIPAFVSTLKAAFSAAVIIAVAATNRGCCHCHFRH